MGNAPVRVALPDMGRHSIPRDCDHPCMSSASSSKNGKRGPWYIPEQYDRDNTRTFRQARSAGSQGAGPRVSSTESATGPQTTAPEAAVAVEAEAWDSSEGEPGSATESSESEAAPGDMRLLR